MIVVMQAHSNDETIEHVMAFLKDHGLSGHLSQGVERTVIGVLGAVGPSGTRSTAGGLNPSISEALEGLPGSALQTGPRHAAEIRFSSSRRAICRTAGNARHSAGLDFLARPLLPLGFCTLRELTLTARPFDDLEIRPGKSVCATSGSFRHRLRLPGRS